LRHYKLYHTVT